MSPVSDKVKRVLDALNAREPDRVPVGEFFWTNFVRRCKEELEVGEDFDPYPSFVLRHSPTTTTVWFNAGAVGGNFKERCESPMIST